MKHYVSALGYGSQALKLLQEYFEGFVPYLGEDDDFETRAKAKQIEAINFSFCSRVFVI